MIISHLATACLIYLSLVLQSCLAGELAFHSFRPWFPGIVLAIGVLLHKEIAGLVWSGIIGLAVDCLSGERLGVHLVISTFVAMGLMVSRHDIQSNRPVSLCVLVFVGSFLWRFVSMATHAVLAGRGAVFHDSLTIAFGDSIYSTVLTAAVVLLFCLSLKAFGRRETATSITFSNRWTMLNR